MFFRFVFVRPYVKRTSQNQKQLREYDAFNCRIVGHVMAAEMVSKKHSDLNGVVSQCVWIRFH